MMKNVAPTAVVPKTLAGHHSLTFTEQFCAEQKLKVTSTLSAVSSLGEPTGEKAFRKEWQTQRIKENQRELFLKRIEARRQRRPFLTKHAMAGLLPTLQSFDYSAVAKR